jgi:hypothetical protein
MVGWPKDSNGIAHLVEPSRKPKPKPIPIGFAYPENRPMVGFVFPNSFRFWLHASQYTSVKAKKTDFCFSIFKIKLTNPDFFLNPETNLDRKSSLLHKTDPNPAQRPKLYPLTTIWQHWTRRVPDGVGKKEEEKQKEGTQRRKEWVEIEGTCGKIAKYEHGRLWLCNFHPNVSSHVHYASVLWPERSRRTFKPQLSIFSV